MKIHEYQAKEIFRSHGIPVLRGFPAFSVEEAIAAAQNLSSGPWVVKAQIHAGGRGKAGGVKVARTLDEVRLISESILGSILVTKQTGPQGKKVERLYIEECAEIEREFYAAAAVDRATQKICLIVSAAGGMEIEEVAEKKPDAIRKILVDPEKGLSREDALLAAGELGLDGESLGRAAGFLESLYRVFCETDASLAETNPLGVLKDGTLAALDAKLSFDDNALYRHPELESLRDLSEEDPLETEAKSAGLSYIALDGSIACMVNGAGLAMATMDTIKLYGGEPANFLDVGGGASVEKVTAAFRIMLANPRVKTVLVNIFGGIMHCDTIASGIVEACREVNLSVPLIVRMNGTNEMEGREILRASGLPVIPAVNMAEAAMKAVQAAAGARA